MDALILWNYWINYQFSGISFSEVTVVEIGDSSVSGIVSVQLVMFSCETLNLAENFWPQSHLMEIDDVVDDGSPLPRSNLNIISWPKD